MMLIIPYLHIFVDFYQQDIIINFMDVIIMV